jgi:hypothetical protein
VFDPVELAGRSHAGGNQDGGSPSQTRHADAAA